jgi:hypothetical protein
MHSLVELVTRIIDSAMRKRGWMEKAGILILMECALSYTWWRQALVCDCLLYHAEREKTSSPLNTTSISTRTKRCVVEEWPPRYKI